MIQLPATDTRRLAIESDIDYPILLACQIDAPESQGGRIYLNGSSGHSPIINSNTYVPNKIAQVKMPKQVSGAHRGIFEVTLIDINNEYHNKLVAEGYTGIKIRTGYFWLYENSWTDILWRYHGTIASLTRHDDMLLIKAANFLAKLDNYHTVVATDRSQRIRNESDDSLSQINTAKLHKFGGASRS